MSNRIYGRHYRHDNRCDEHPVWKKKTSRTYRYWPARRSLDQGDTPMCVGYAAAHWLACAPYHTKFIDPAGIYRYSQWEDEYEGEKYEGTSVLGAARVLQKCGVIKSYQWATTVEQVVNHLLTTGPVMLGTDWTEGMETPYCGVIDDTGAFLGGHAYLAMGVNTDTGCVRVKNSWGRQWGEGGHAWLPDYVLDELLAADGEACVAVPNQ